MLFADRFLAGLRDGSITTTVRRWKSARVKVGGRYRVRPGLALEVTAVEPLGGDGPTDAQARTSGFAAADVLWAELLRKAPRDGGRTLYLVTFRRVPDVAPGPPSHDTGLSPQDVAKLTGRLEQMDARSKAGAWTRPTLNLIAERPGTRAGDLAEALGRDKAKLKADIRKLKKLGLTLSLETGYEVSPRGAVYLAAVCAGSENSRDP